MDCRAVCDDRGLGYCRLGFKTQSADIKSFGCCYLKPAEPCPKPRTFQEYFDCMDNKKYKLHKKKKHYC